MENSSAVQPEKKKPARKGLKIGSTVFPYIMIAPALLIFIIFVVFPLFYMIYVSFFDWNMIGDMDFIGFDNYIKMFKSADFRQILLNTFKYMLMYVPPTIILSMLIAVYLKKNTRINRFIQGVVFMPSIVSLVSISFIWIWIMNSDTGLFNYILNLFGIDSIGWLTDSKYAMFSLVLVNVWKSLGYYVLIFLTGLQSIPGNLYEAAAIDRSKGPTTFMKITLPMLSPTLFFCTLTCLISAFKTFESVSIMTGGGPGNSTNVLTYYIYQQGFMYYKTGYASAMGVVMMILIGIMTIIYFGVLQKKVHYQ